MGQRTSQTIDCVFVFVSSFWKTKTQAAQDVDSGSSHRERAPPYMRTPPVDVDLGGTPLLPPLPLCLTPFEASRREMAPPYMRTLPVDVDLGASHQEMVQSERRTQPAEYVDLERQRIRAHNLRENTDHFRVLIIGRANAGKTTILQRVCNTTKQPKLFNPKGHKIDLSVLDPTAKVIKNFFVIVSYSTSGSEESTTLRMK